MRAGLFDRAERLFSELIDRESQAPSALRHLLDIYQQEKDWENALSIAAKLEAATDEPMGSFMSHFCCELAELELEKEKPEMARKFLGRGRRYDPESARALFIAARIAEQKDHFSEALGIYEQIVELDPDYIPILIDHYFASAARANDEERARKKLEEWSGDHSGISLVLHQATLIAAEDGKKKAAEFMTGALEEQPSVQGLERLMQLRKEAGEAIDSSAEILHSITRELLASQSSYRCGHCGFSGHNHHWQCPSCKQWGTTRVIRGVLGE
jgi:lipopolysaccharide biosynthesis regulator YciM